MIYGSISLIVQPFVIKLERAAIANAPIAWFEGADNVLFTPFTAVISKR